MQRSILTRDSFKRQDGVELFRTETGDIGIACTRTGRLVATVGEGDLFDGAGNRFDLSQLGERPV